MTVLGYKNRFSIFELSSRKFSGTQNFSKSVEESKDEEIA